MRLTMLLAAGAATIALLPVSSADAGGIRRPPTSYPAGYVVAESRFGNGVVSGPVRPTSLGWQVRLPGGTWEYCRRSCGETLRVNTVDFWEGDPQAGRGQLINECGIFGCLDIRYPR